MKRLVRHVTSIYAVYALKGILGLVFIPSALNQLGTEHYGIYTIFLTLTAYIVFIELGTTKNLSRLLAMEKDEDAKKQHLQSTLGIYIIFCIALLILLPLLQTLIPVIIFPVDQLNLPVLKLIILLAVIDYIASVPTSMFQAYCIAEERFNNYSKYQFVSGILKYSFMYTGLFCFSRPDILVMFMVFARCTDILSARVLMGALPQGSWSPRFRYQKIKLLLGASFVLSTSQFLQQTVIAIGSVLVNRFFGLHYLGIYRSAFDLATKVWFFSNAIGLVIFPKFVRMLVDPQERTLLYNRLPFILLISWFSYYLLNMAGVLLAPVGLKLMGMSEHETVGLFVILLLGVCINAHSNLSYELLLAGGRYWMGAALNGGALFLLISCFLIFYQTGGVLAIGWSWLISQMVYALATDFVTLSHAGKSLSIQLKSMSFSIFFGLNCLMAVFVRTQPIPDFILVIPFALIFIYAALSYKKVRMKLASFIRSD
ncbi:lipopolysaccharide biosynthesis protein [Bacillus sp. SG-1]|uniref:lipopolysaccharide biosynthesis protein n=1 Tax=Bacillus sp. SG-1 TaxID=161544 RepID=UPI000154356A|nr:oligosaccharide flippase family protein [Bacillus sp. SG-1]EDL65259.1 hypothetical protein BSG1_11796 [Bacillus sp. SG-1]